MAEEPAGCVATIEDIRDRMQEAKEADTPFAVLLGAGASVTAGIPTAIEMAKEVAADKYSQETDKKPPEDPEVLWSWLKGHPRWKQHFDEWRKPHLDLDDAFLRYAVCMGELLDAHGRRKLLLEKCENARGPNWAHLFVAQLIDKGYVDTVLTTNFDDLMQRALILYPDSQIPAVCAHPQSAAHVDSSPERPQLVYLHGSALYYDTCHTPGEVEKLREGLREALHRIIHDRGLIVVGYRGAEPDVMLALQALLDARPLAHRLYWIAHERNYGELASLARDGLPWGSDCRLMCGQDADEFFADLCGYEKGLGLEVPEFVRRPLEHGLQAINGIAEMPGSPGAPTATIVAEARRELQGAANALRSKHGREKFQQAIEEHRKGTPEAMRQAIELYEKAVEERPQYPEVLNNWGTALGELGRLQREEDPAAAQNAFEAATQKFERALDYRPEYAEALYNWCIALVELGRLQEDEEPAAAKASFKAACEKCDQAVDQGPEAPEALTNWSAALIALGHLVADSGERHEAQTLFEQAREKAQRAVDLGAEKAPYNVACAEALLGNLDEAFEGLREVLERGVIPWPHVADDEDWGDLRDEPRYRELEEEFGEADGGNDNSDNEGTDE